MEYNKEEFKQDYYKLSYRELMEKYKISKQTIINRLDVMGIPPKTKRLNPIIPTCFKDYIQHHTQRKAMYHYGISKGTLRRWCRRVGFEKYPYSGLKTKVNIEEFKKLYPIMKKQDLADKYDVSIATIFNWAKKLGIIK